ncbi:unnamed protein product [Rotaria socialis]|uniref:CWH43-like N-terminal domain-containing protein n=1 Tax=Rotaria socialis TaxID=392032 RepID=A0A818RUL2_9BILA|nr:unnamed protein product [Rotaria socialis]CAF3543850.1 unnamed protein product [Rotaria socialis]CAF3659498.1 unnamed protein product [Rotaria socialis]CAF4350122.1 unnamed protein product [Rotaria socialis]CAF4457706.1 unnamed protein product [Rotaria socialis]
MTNTCTVIWFRIILILPFTSILTLVLTLIICSQVPNNIQPGEQLPRISDLGTGEAHNYFMSGFIILLPQFLFMFIGRLQFLIQSQKIVHCAIILLIHVSLFICGIFLLIMAILNEDDRPTLHLVGAIGTFACIAFYCILHTILIIYLFIHRSEAIEHSNFILPLWFLGCTIMSVASSIALVVTFTSIPEYFAVGTPFLYFLGFVPQFWSKAKLIKADTNLTHTVRNSNPSET